MKTKIINYNDDYYLINKEDLEVVLLAEDEDDGGIVFNGIKLSETDLSVWDNQIGVRINGEATAYEIKRIIEVFLKYID